MLSKATCLRINHYLSKKTVFLLAKPNITKFVVLNPKKTTITSTTSHNNHNILFVYSIQSWKSKLNPNQNLSKSHFVGELMIFISSNQCIQCILTVHDCSASCQARSTPRHKLQDSLTFSSVPGDPSKQDVSCNREFI